MQQFFIAPAWFSDHGISKAMPPAQAPLLPLPGELNHQLVRVLRIRGGEQVRLADGQGRIYLAQLQKTGNRVKARLLSMFAKEEGLGLPLCLCQAKIRKERWEWMLQKACELGVNRIIPVETEYTNQKWQLTDHLRQRQEAILREAAEQSERFTIPVLEEECRLDDLTPSSEELCLFPCERSEGQTRSLFDWACSQDPQKLKEPHPKGVRLLIGPEGGFSPEEKENLLQRGWKAVSLGRRILRAETAAIYSTGLVREILDRENA